MRHFPPCNLEYMMRARKRDIMDNKESMLVNVSNGLEEMEGTRRVTGISSSSRTGALAGLSVVPDSEVPKKAVRRRFTAEYKRRILRRRKPAKTRVGWAALSLVLECLGDSRTKNYYCAWEMILKPPREG